MAGKAAATEKRIGGRGRRRQAVTKSKKIVDPDDVLTLEEGLLVKKGERQIKKGKFVTLAQLKRDLVRKDSQRDRKTA